MRSQTIVRGILESTKYPQTRSRFVLAAAIFGTLFFAPKDRARAEDALTLDAIFPTDRVLDVQITVAEEDWDTIRHQSRDFFTALGAARKEAPVEGPFTYVEASVTIDGVTFPKIGLRKKGFIGSLSPTRPSLKVKLNHVDPAGQIGGLKSLTLNNNKQDVSLVSQYLGYALFNATGSPAPRCAFANVTVNGKDLGIYSHVESARKTLLARGFGDDNGTLYEGTVTDFYEGWGGSFERKVGDAVAGRAKIDALIAALNGAGGEVIVSAEAESRARVATSDAHSGDWMKPEFDDGNWAKGNGGAGYETGSGYEELIAPEFDFENELKGESGSIYVRKTFELDDVSKIEELTLRARFDDGFVAYLNGHRIAAANAPDQPKWNSNATGPNDDGGAVQLQPFYITEHVDKLRRGKNVLALHGFNVEPSSSDYLIAAELRAGDTPSHENLARLVNLDAFYRFWAIEGLLGFWDGYSGNRNNFFAYLNPKDSKFHFVPWGADSMFVKFSKINRDRSVPLSVKIEGLIAHRLYQTASGRARYLKTLTEILETHWNEEKLLAETDRIEALLAPYAEKVREQRRFPRELERVREFIRERRGDLVSETAEGMPIWTKPPSAPPLIPAGAGRGPFGDRNAGKKPDLWTAAREGDVAKLKKQMAEPRIDLNALDAIGSSALSWAAGLGRVDAVAYLLEKGADVNTRNRDGSTPLDAAVKELEDGAEDFLRTMFKIEIDPDEVATARPKIEKLLRDRGAKLGSELKDTPAADLWAAARQGDTKAISKFLKSGADIDEKDKIGSTALSWAAGLGQFDAVKLLLAEGADVNARNNDGTTPLDGTTKDLDDGAANFLFALFKVRVDPKKVNASKPKVAELLRKHGGKKGSDDKRSADDTK